MMDRNAEAFCGLFCAACPAYLKRDQDWIVQSILERHGLTMDELHCEGCRSETLSPSCQDCAIRECARSKGLDSCSACPDLPCERISRFGSLRPHTAEALGNLTSLRAHGAREWLLAQDTQWRCTGCGRGGSWYETTCGDCGLPLPAGYPREETSNGS